jgi:transcriptional regulator with XRE-family HTH domain
MARSGKKPKVRINNSQAAPKYREIDIEETLDASESMKKASDDYVNVLEAADLIAYWIKNAPNNDGTRGITQTELARRLGVTQARVSQLINAESARGPSYSLVRKVCAACGFAWPSGLVEAFSSISPEEHIDEEHIDDVLVPTLSFRPSGNYKIKEELAENSFFIDVVSTLQRALADMDDFGGGIDVAERSAERFLFVRPPAFDTFSGTGPSVVETYRLLTEFYKHTLKQEETRGFVVTPIGASIGARNEDDPSILILGEESDYLEDRR